MRAFLAELRRRQVVRVALVYAIVGWLLMQVADVMFPALVLPDWTVRLVAALLILGFPVALVLAWAFDVTPEGIRRTESADEAPAKHASQWVDGIIMALLVAGVAYFAYAELRPHADTGPIGMEATGSGEPPQSIAVLAFTNMSDDPGSVYFSDGIAEELLNLLSRVPDLTVSSRTLAMNRTVIAKRR